MGFPTSLPSFAGFTSSHTLAVDSHASQHNSEQSEVVAIATKIGTGSSTPSASTVLRGTGAGTSFWGQVVLSSDVTGTLPLGNGGLGVTSLADFKTTYSALLYPVGSIYINATDSTNPATLLGFGTWSAFGQGRVMVGLNSSDTDFDSAEDTGGEKTHTLTTAEMPSHSHTSGDGTGYVVGGATGVAASITQTGAAFRVANGNNTGGSGAHNNLQPYIVVYMWKRVS